MPDMNQLQPISGHEGFQLVDCTWLRVDSLVIDDQEHSRQLWRLKVNTGASSGLVVSKGDCLLNVQQRFADIPPQFVRGETS